MLSLRGVCCRLIWSASSGIVVCYSWTAVYEDLRYRTPQLGVLKVTPAQRSREGGMPGGEISAKEPRDSGDRDMVNESDVGDANWSVALFANPGRVETMLLLQTVVV